MNPLHEPEMTAIRAANAMMGTDPNCGNWIVANRDPSAAATGAEGGRRGGGRRRRG